MQIFTLLVVLALAIAVFLTTPAGKKLAARLGLSLSNKGMASNEDHEYLLRVCDDDIDELSARLRTARRSNPDMTEAEAYRRAIRVHLRDKM
ncbi:MAG: hypothetical protein JRG89_07605 [Deltaproteobacteria bacterium]|nr:hypothetical protein [Deltaproteobacteria bacterium]MBW2388289.1 hypothetical protein [Deltaproteobacteria bacterium]MBW2724332.1 hypothetical protein [Deltaproteobacteria bacterium]